MKQLATCDVMRDLAQLVNRSECTSEQAVKLRQAIDYGNRAMYLQCMRELADVAADRENKDSTESIGETLEYAAVSYDKLTNDCFHVASYQWRLGNHLNAIQEVIDGLGGVL